MCSLMRIVKSVVKHWINLDFIWSFFHCMVESLTKYYHLTEYCFITQVSSFDIL